MKLNKRGISLIVLVITIIVMIILAAAIILALNGNNVVGRANQAKASSDLSNKEEAASVYLSEYNLNVAEGKIDSTKITADAYVKERLDSQGMSIDDVAVTDEGKILVGVAGMLVNQKVPIGAEVQGYKLNSTTTYPTSGNEDTCNYENLTETGPQQDELIRDENITWQYFGTDRNGNALIVGSVTADSTDMTLGGKGGYLNGPQELNNACKAMYSSSMGTARSIDLDDVTRVLGYTGDKGSYREQSEGTYTPTKVAKTISELAKELKISMEGIVRDTPEEGKDFGAYKSNYYKIDGYGSTEADLIIFPRSASTSPQLTRQYWLASPCVYANFYETVTAGFGVYIVNKSGTRIVSTFNPTVSSAFDVNKIRPVVVLNSSVQMTYEDNIVKLK